MASGQELKLIESNIPERIKNTEETTGKQIGLSIIPHDLPENKMPLAEIESSDNEIPSKRDIVSPTKYVPLSVTDKRKST